jgi:hypothetical protein
LTPFAKSWEINRGCPLPADFGLPSFARNSSWLLVVIAVPLAYSGAVDRNRLAQMSNASSPYQISSIVDLGGVPQKTMCRHSLKRATPRGFNLALRFFAHTFPFSL